MCLLCISGTCPPGICQATVYSPFESIKASLALIPVIISILAFKMKSFYHKLRNKK